MNDLQQFQYEMLREIYEQPAALNRTLALYIEGNNHKGDVAERLKGWANSAGRPLRPGRGCGICERAELPWRP
jgi:glucosamine 6-phosphate synthetase-like amidotransferase/phosphosugar isomerase protein